MEGIETRNATFSDLDKVVELENKIWPEGTRAPREKFESRLKIFSVGFFIAIKEGDVVGVSTSEIINYDSRNPPTSWEAITDNGWIKKTHKPSGNALYVVSIGAISRSGGGSALLEAQKNLCRKLSLDCMILGSRIPGYDDCCRKNGEMGINDYVKLTRENGDSFDPELRFYFRNGLRTIKIVANYMEDDSESRNYGALMVWLNN